MPAVNVADLLTEFFTEQSPVAGSLTGPTESSDLKRVNIRPAVIKERKVHQFEYLSENRAHHRNLVESEAREELRDLLSRFRQAELSTPESAYLITATRDGGRKIKQKTASKPPTIQPHDLPKQRIIPEGVPNDFLLRLGVMAANGRVVASKRDKFLQINRFLEMVADIARYLPKDRPVRIVDFGCGKSYLTFALYHYLHGIRGLEVQITGLDLKQDVIAYCNTVARDLSYDGLEFLVGEIGSYTGEGPVDMVVSLHACDTATDDALAKAVEWDAKVILSVPCCQHELNKQLRNPLMKPMLKHGIIRDRLTEIVTDSARASILELCGYSVQLMEFIATEHTPKNLLIRAVKQAKKPQPSKIEEYRAFADIWGINPALERALQNHVRLGEPK